MKNWKNILLTVLAVLLLVGFGWAVTSPTITEDAAERHTNLDFPEDEESGLYDFL